MNKEELEAYWTNRYVEQNTGWDVGYASTPIKEYIDQLDNKDLKILIPGAGNAYEAEYLFMQGYKNTEVLDISELPLKALQKRCPTFPQAQLRQGNFFNHTGKYDLIIEQTFFCSFEPSSANRKSYAEQMSKLLKPSGRLIGLWFDHPQIANGKRPFGGTRDEYLEYLSPHFETRTFEKCHNSIKPRAGKELFGIFVKRI